MKIYYLIFLTFLLSPLSITQNSYLVDTYTDVYICNSKYGKKYHFNKNCRGLNACKAEIKKLSLLNAKKKGKTLCGWED